jgi:hypothetical protein
MAGGAKRLEIDSYALLPEPVAVSQMVGLERIAATAFSAFGEAHPLLLLARQ